MIGRIVRAFLRRIYDPGDPEELADQILAAVREEAGETA